MYPIVSPFKWRHIVFFKHLLISCFVSVFILKVALKIYDNQMKLTETLLKHTCASFVGFLMLNYFVAARIWHFWLFEVIILPFCDHAVSYSKQSLFYFNFDFSDISRDCINTIVTFWNFKEFIDLIYLLFSSSYLSYTY